MRKSNYLDLDGHILRTFLAILDENSVSRASERLGVTQSAVSHTLARLRTILGDPLFVRSGHGLTPTATALLLKERAQGVLDDLKCLTEQRPFDPTKELLEFNIAANDMQRELVFPQLLAEAREEGVALALEFMPSAIPSLAMLRDARCQMMLTPLPPLGSDIFQLKLFQGNMMCFYDASVRDAPKSWEEYRNCEHVAVRFAGGRGSSEVLRGVDHDLIRAPTVTVSNFNAIPAFIHGSPLICTEMAHMRLGPLRDLAAAPLPFDSDPVPIYMVWHERSQNDPPHMWLRKRIERIAAGIGPKLLELDQQQD